MKKGKYIRKYYKNKKVKNLHHRKFLTFFCKIFHYNSGAITLLFIKKHKSVKNSRRVKKLEKLKQNPIVKKLGLNRILLVGILILMFAVFKVVLGSKFPVGDSIKSTLNYVYFLGFLSLGVTFVIATGGIDFSIGPVMFCCALVSGYCMTSYGVPCAVAMVICVLIGLCFGTFNGWLVSYMSVPPFIVSMASMNIAKGLASVFTKTQSVSWPLSSDPVNGWFRNIVSVNGFPVGILIFLTVAVICGIVLYRTKPGRYILCLGSNSEAVRLSGVNTRKWRMLAYMICGFLVGIAALFFVATYTTVQPGYGDQYNNEAIAGCVMGGTSMVGGLASIGGTVIGVFIISLLQQGIMAFGLGKGQQMIITGIIVIVAVYADVSARRRKN